MKINEHICVNKAVKYNSEWYKCIGNTSKGYLQIDGLNKTVFANDIEEFKPIEKQNVYMLARETINIGDTIEGFKIFKITGVTTDFEECKIGLHCEGIRV